MTRRGLLKVLCAVLPVGAAARVIDDVRPTDIVAITHPGILSQQACENIRVACQAAWKGPAPAPTIIVLTEGMTIQRFRLSTVRRLS